jgi:catechol 2,3-dioxygenase-like lactoylglutathione lyase family enzyme
MTAEFAGIHHLALYTRDLDRTLDFYRSQERLDADGIATREFPELGTFAFSDPNGIMVEIVRG